MHDADMLANILLILSGPMMCVLAVFIVAKLLK